MAPFRIAFALDVVAVPMPADGPQSFGMMRLCIAEHLDHVGS
jgi:hypothetical protein